MIADLKILRQHGKQYIPDITKAEVPTPFRGRPIISNEKVDEDALVELCPVNAIASSPVRLDLGKCAFCGECAFAFPDKITFSNDHLIATNDYDRLMIVEGEQSKITVDKSKIRKEIVGMFGRSLKLRQVSAAGDNSGELELGACGNVNFDMGSFGIEFVASPRHADGIVVTGPISKNMAEALEICYYAVPEPRLLILVGTDAVSGGIFAGSPALDRSFLERHQVDLYVPGNPAHPLTFINGILDLIRST
jgi:Ni,Fe-hydrogenase III small subunit